VYYPKGKRWWGWLHEQGGKWTAPRARAATKLYDRTGDEITLDEVERIRI
jgi:hypothetical protein